MGTPINHAFHWNWAGGTVIAALPIKVREGESMLRKVARLFTIRTRLEAFLIIYALALGATSRGSHYLTEYPGGAGQALFFACTGAVFLAGGKILDCLRYEHAAKDQAGPSEA